MYIRLFTATLLGIGLASCLSFSPGSSEHSFDAPETITGCEVFHVQVCWTWVREGSRYVHSGSDGATADMEIVRLTETEIVLRRVDYGKHENFTALYAGMITRNQVRAGAVTWNHSGNVRAGRWWAHG